MAVLLRNLQPSSQSPPFLRSCFRSAITAISQVRNDTLAKIGSLWHMVYQKSGRQVRPLG